MGDVSVTGALDPQQRDIGVMFQKWFQHASIAEWIDNIYNHESAFQSMVWGPLFNLLIGARFSDSQIAALASPSGFSAYLNRNDITRIDKLLFKFPIEWGMTILYPIAQAGRMRRIENRTGNDNPFVDAQTWLASYNNLHSVVLCIQSQKGDIDIQWAIDSLLPHVQVLEAAFWVVKGKNACDCPMMAEKHVAVYTALTLAITAMASFGHRKLNEEPGTGMARRIQGDINRYLEIVLDKNAVGEIQSYPSVVAMVDKSFADGTLSKDADYYWPFFGPESGIDWDSQQKLGPLVVYYGLQSLGVGTSAPFGSLAIGDLASGIRQNMIDFVSTDWERDPEFHQYFISHRPLTHLRGENPFPIAKR